jgi:hypothetical protein
MSVNISTTPNNAVYFNLSGDQLMVHISQCRERNLCI